MREKIELDYVIRALERLKAWVEVEEEQANRMIREAENDRHQAINFGRSQAFGEVRVRIVTLRIVLEEVAKQ